MPTPRRIHAVFTWVVFAVSVSPSHLPVVKPPVGCGALADGCGRASIQILVSPRRLSPPRIQEMTWPRLSVSGQIFSPRGRYGKTIDDWARHWRSKIDGRFEV